MGKEKNKKITYLITIFVLIAVVIGISYAVFQFMGAGEKENVIVAGNLQLTLEESNILTLSNYYPMTDVAAASDNNIANTFTLENTGTVPANYELYLDPVSVSGTRLEDRFLKYSLAKTGSSTGTINATSLTALTNDLLDSGTLAAGGKINYTLKIWITTDIDGDIGGQQWAARLRVEGRQ